MASCWDANGAEKESDRFNERHEHNASHRRPFVSLCDEMPLQKVSISDIVERTGKNRKTFYYHFVDKNYLINRIFRYDLGQALRSHFPEELLVYEKDTDSSMAQFPYYIRKKSGIRSLDHSEFFGVFARVLESRRKFYTQALLETSPNALRNYLYALYLPALKSDIDYRSSPTVIFPRTTPTSWPNSTHAHFCITSFENATSLASSTSSPTLAPSRTSSIAPSKRRSPKRSSAGFPNPLRIGEKKEEEIDGLQPDRRAGAPHRKRRRIRKAHFDERTVDAMYTNHGIPVEIAEAYRDAGFALMGLPEEVGGIPCDKLTLGIMTEKLYHATGCMTPFMTAMLATADVAEFGTHQQATRIVDQYAKSGMPVASLGLSEPGAGSDNKAMSTYTKKQPDETYILRGQKTWVTNGGNTPYMIVVAKDEHPARANESMSMWLIPTDLEGVSTTALDKIGQQIIPFVDVFFDDVRITEDMRLGEQGEGFLLLMKNFEIERCLVAAQSMALRKLAWMMPRPTQASGTPSTSPSGRIP